MSLAHCLPALLTSLIRLAFRSIAGGECENVNAWHVKGATVNHWQKYVHNLAWQLSACGAFSPMWRYC